MAQPQALFGIGDSSNESLDLDFDLFSKPVPNDDYYSYRDVTIKPRDPLQNIGDNPILFDLGGESSRHYIIPSTIQVHGHLKVTLKDGEDFDDTVSVSPVNMFPHALFQEISVKINNVLVSDHFREYPYKSYIQSHFGTSLAAKTCGMTNEWYVADTLASETVDNANLVLKARGTGIKASKTAYFTFQPKIDIAAMSRLFPPSHKITLEFFRSKPEFCLLYAGGDKNFDIKILDMSVTCREVLPNERLENSMKLKMAKKDILLPIHRVVARTRGIYAGVIDGSINNIIVGKMPNHLMVFLLSNTQINGSLGTNPFHFGPHGLKEFNLVVNGQNFPGEKMTFDPATGDYNRAYAHFMSNIGMPHDCETGITPELYKTNSFGIAFDLTPDLCLNHHLHKTDDSSTVDLKLVFKTALTDAITILYLATFDNIITLQPDKSLKTDFAM